MRVSYVVLACGFACLPERALSTSATFDVRCQVVRETNRQPVAGIWVNFSAARYDLDGAQDPDSVVTSGQPSASYDPAHPGTASFVVAYTLRRDGEAEELATFTCATAGDDPVRASELRAFSDVDHEGAVVDVAIVLAVP